MQSIFVCFLVYLYVWFFLYYVRVDFFYIMYAYYRVLYNHNRMYTCCCVNAWMHMCTCIYNIHVERCMFMNDLIIRLPSSQFVGCAVTPQKCRVATSGLLWMVAKSCTSWELWKATNHGIIMRWNTNCCRISLAHLLYVRENFQMMFTRDQQLFMFKSQYINEQCSKSFYHSILLVGL